MKLPQSDSSRRRFIKTAAASSGLLLTAQTGFGFNILKSLGDKSSVVNGVTLGVITYSFRSMPDQDAEATLQYVTDCGITHIELMGDPAESYAGKPKSSMSRREMFAVYRMSRRDDLSEDEKKELAEAQKQMDAYNKEVAKWRESVSMDKFEDFRKMYKKAGVTIYAFKPSTFGINNTDADINYGMHAAKALGANQVTVEIPGNDDQTARLGALGAANKMYVGYHGHEQQTPTVWDVALEQSKYNAMNLDLGHYIAAGNTDALELIQAKNKRISSMHVKDRQTPENGKGNVVWGTGDTPIVEVLQLMRDNKYTFPATVELEYQIPDGSDAVKETTRCIEYCKNALES